MEIMEIKREVEARQERIDKEIEENLGDELSDLPDLLFLQQREQALRVADERAKRLSSRRLVGEKGSRRVVVDTPATEELRKVHRLLSTFVADIPRPSTPEATAEDLEDRLLARFEENTAQISEIPKSVALKMLSEFVSLKKEEDGRKVEAASQTKAQYIVPASFQELKDKLALALKQREQKEEALQRAEGQVEQLREDVRALDKELREFKWKVVNSATRRLSQQARKPRPLRDAEVQTELSCFSISASPQRRISAKIASPPPFDGSWSREQVSRLPTQSEALESVEMSSVQPLQLRASVPTTKRPSISIISSNSSLKHRIIEVRPFSDRGSTGPFEPLHSRRHLAPEPSEPQTARLRKSLGGEKLLPEVRSGGELLVQGRRGPAAPTRNGKIAAASKGGSAGGGGGGLARMLARPRSAATATAGGFYQRSVRREAEAFY